MCMNFVLCSIGILRHFQFSLEICGLFCMCTTQTGEESVRKRVASSDGFRGTRKLLTVCVCVSAYNDPTMSWSLVSLSENVRQLKHWTLCHFHLQSFVEILSMFFWYGQNIVWRLFYLCSDLTLSSCVVVFGSHNATLSCPLWFNFAILL